MKFKYNIYEYMNSYDFVIIYLRVHVSRVSYIIYIYRFYREWTSLTLNEYAWQVMPM